MNNENDMKVLYGVAVVFVALFMIFLTAAIIKGYTLFKSKRDYYFMEIQRSDEYERQYWEDELKDLYLSYIPFVGELIVDVRKKRRKKRNSDE